MPFFSAQELHFDVLKYDLDFNMTLTFTDKFSKFRTFFAIFIFLNLHKMYLEIAIYILRAFL
jgi:hypothetical protein